MFIIPAVPIQIWNSAGTRRYGQERENWVFVCPSCGRAQSLKTLKSTFPNVDPYMFFIGQSCGFRHDVENPCNHYHLSGRQNPVKIINKMGDYFWEIPVMDFEQPIIFDVIGPLTGHNFEVQNYA